MHALLVAGARPNFMKVAPVLRALEVDGTSTTLVHSGQHYDTALSDVFFSDLNLRAPDHHLGVGSGTHAEQTAKIMTAFEPVLESESPDVVIVVGDVNSTVACGLVAAKGGILLAHVEAGLRSRDWMMPEEVNRVTTDRLSDFLFAPSPDAVDNLRAEGYREDQIHLAGNVMVDCLLDNLDRARERPILDELGLGVRGYGLVTLHRPSNVDDPEVLSSLLEALGDVAGRIPLVFPAHPRTRPLLESLGTPPGITIIPPAGYLDFVALEAAAALVLTDSGGVQEETTVLGVPCLTLRENTERPITIEQGSNRLVGTDPDAIRLAAAEILDMAPRDFPRPDLWDGNASVRISQVLHEHVGPAHLRPTEEAKPAAPTTASVPSDASSNLRYVKAGSDNTDNRTGDLLKFDRNTILPLSGLLLGLTLVLFADTLIQLITDCIPLSARVTSKGTYFGRFADIAPEIATRTGLLLAIAGSVSLFVRPGATWAHRRMPVKPILAMLLVATALWFAWLSYRHNAFPTNARILWVDYFVRPSRLDDFMYALLRLPHFIFYEHPFVWQSLNATANAAILFGLGRRMRLPDIATLGISILIAISGNILLFANTAEDVMLNVGLISLVFLAQSYRNPFWLGTALTLVILGRPQFALLLPCVLAGEGIAELRRFRTLRRISWRYLIQTVLVTTGLTTAAQVVLTILGGRYFFVNGAIYDMGGNAGLTPIESDGFIISAFSGAYFGHLLWVFPLPFIVGSILGLASARHRTPRIEAMVYSAGFAVLGLLILNETEPLLYFNVRYLTYYLPLFVVMAWSLYSNDGAGSRNRQTGTRLRAIGLILLILAPATIPSGAVEHRQKLAQRPEYELITVKEELRDLTEGKPILIDTPSRFVKNFVAYVLRRDVGTIMYLDIDAPPSEGVVLLRKSSTAFTSLLASSNNTLLETETYLVARIDAGN